MRVAITGSSGLIGRHLRASLTADGHEVVPVVRDPGQEGIYWSPSAGDVDARGFAGLDAVVHLAGEPIGQRWTAKAKRRIRDSRVVGTRLLADALASLDDPPGVLVSTSAVGYYGDRGEEVLTEESAPGEGFLAAVCVAWEAAADPARAAGIRVVHPRNGVVLASEGAFISKVETPFRLGVGGRVGSGRQWVPWIALEDQVGALRHLVDRDDLDGPFNLTAPQPVRNAELTRALGEVLHRPTLLPIPPIAIRLLYGEMGVTLATWSQQVIPQRLLDAGFEFRHADVRGALRLALAR